MIRSCKCIFCALLVLGTAGSALCADVYPSKPIHIVVAAGPGGLVDVITRLVAQKMSDKLGQPIVVENQGAAGTLMGIRGVKRAPADGYTLLATSNSIAIQPAVKLDPGYELSDFVGIGEMIRSPWMVIVGPNQPDKTIADFLARAKAKPDSVSFASGGVGTAPHMAAESLLQRAGVKILHVPYKGVGPAIPDVMSGRVTMVFDGVSSSAERIRAGQLRSLGVTSANRLPQFPNIPTIAEQGMPDFTSYVWVGLLAPAGTPKDVVRRLSEVMQSVTFGPELRVRFDADGVEPVRMSAAEFDEALKQEAIDMAKLAAKLGIQKE
jgi:tripartite-type tricarboxylate transporter receptor subunit TctC